MPLLHQDPSRGGGGSKENRRSLADFLGFEPPRIEPSAPGRRDDYPHLRDNESEEGGWRWEVPGSPEAAHTPRSLVPPNCFPSTHHPTAFTNFSESARPSSGWSDEAAQPGQGIPDLVASLKALAMPSVGGAGGAPRLETSIQMRLSYDQEQNMVSLWQKDQQPKASRDERLARRASFCGVLQSHRNTNTNGNGNMNGNVNGGGAVCWAGRLPARAIDTSSGGGAGGYSPKVFLGGLPWDITEQSLFNALAQFQPVRVEWPGREAGGVSTGGGEGKGGGGGPRGYAYVTFESERRVRALLAASRRDGADWYYRIASRKMRTKEVQVIPWAVSDASWVSGGSARLEPSRTVFVGALHGMLSAPALATIMNDLFQGVVYAGIDTDKNKYPIGSGRVTFNNVRSYVRAVSAGYITIQTDKFTKKVQVDPYLEDSMCSVCNLHQGPYFCREPLCFRYYCRSCWSYQHQSEEHKPLMRCSKGATGLAYTNVGPNSGLNSGLSNGTGTGLSNGHGYGQRLSPPSDHGSVYNGCFPQSEGTGSPSTSGTSGTSGVSELEPEHSDLAWPPR